MKCNSSTKLGGVNILNIMGNYEMGNKKGNRGIILKADQGQILL